MHSPSVVVSLKIISTQQHQPSDFGDFDVSAQFGETAGYTELNDRVRFSVAPRWPISHRFLSLAAFSLVVYFDVDPFCVGFSKTKPDCD